MTTIKLNTPKNITIRDAIVVNTDTFSRTPWVDDTEKKTVTTTIKIGINTKVITLWSGDAYTAIGNWTESQAESRLLELV